MSTLRVTGLKQETSTATNISLAVGGGVTVAGVSTFYSNVDLGSNSLEGSLQVGTGATISGFTNAIDFLTDGTHRVRLDPSGRLMLGTTTEGYENYADNFTIADSAHCGLTLRSGTTSQGNIYFSDGSSNGSEEYEGIIQYLHSNDAMAFGVNNGQERMRIDSSGNVGINTSSPTSDGGTTLEIYNATTPTLRLNDGGEYKALFQLRGNDLEIRGSNGTMEFYTGNVDGASSTEQMRLDSLGRLIIGHTSSYGVADADDLQVGDNTNSAERGISIGSATAGNIAFADSADSRAGLLQYVHSDNSLRFFVNGVSAGERLRIDSSGRLLVGTTSASGDALLQVNGPIQFGSGDIRMASHARSYTASTSATNLFKVRFVTGHNAAEFTWAFTDSNYANGVRIGKIYMVTRGSGANITHVTITTSTEASITNGSVTGITWSASVHDVNHIKLTATGSTTSGDGVMVLYGTSPSFDTLTPITDV